ncbi:MAG: DUF1893 domain-containing protein [Clostridiales bacterium]|jgi:niacin transporter|nr:DUF1893 domain-containing protein [Clostridiales bacterium]
MELVLTRKKEFSVPVKVALSAVLTVAAVLLPRLAHITGGPELGAMLLPMYLPVILAGFLTGPYFAVAVAAFSPAIAFALTGMPPLIKLPFMTAELMICALTSGILYRKFFNKATERSLPAPFDLRAAFGISAALLSAIIAGRVFYAAAVFVFHNLLAITPLNLTGYLPSVLASWPGMLIQLVLVPLSVMSLKTKSDKDAPKKPNGEKQSFAEQPLKNSEPPSQNDDLKKASELYKENNYTLAVVKGDYVFTSFKTGISPLSDLAKDAPDALCGASAADKAVGGAAAFLYAYCKAKAVHAGLISAKAEAVFKKYGIAYTYETKTDIILARDGINICPFERLCSDLEASEEAFLAVAERIANLRAEKAKRQ